MIPPRLAAALQHELIEHHLAQRVRRPQPAGDHAHGPIAVAAQGGLHHGKVDRDAADADRAEGWRAHYFLRPKHSRHMSSLCGCWPTNFLTSSRISLPSFDDVVVFPLQLLLDPLQAVQFAGGVHGLAEAVGEQREAVARRQVAGELLVGIVGVHAQRHAGLLLAQRPHVALGVPQVRGHVAGVDQRELVLRGNRSDPAPTSRSGLPSRGGQSSG